MPFGCRNNGGYRYPSRSTKGGGLYGSGLCDGEHSVHESGVVASVCEAPAQRSKGSEMDLFVYDSLTLLPERREN